MLDAGKAQDKECNCAAGDGGDAQAAGSSNARRLEAIAAKGKGPIGADTPSSRAAPAPAK